MADDPRSAWLEAAMEKWETSLLRTCFAYLGDAALAEDAVQDTFLKAWKGYGCFRGEAEEKTWLIRIAINTCKDMQKSAWFRHTDRSLVLDRLPEGSASFTPADDTVTRAVLRLPPKLREVVILLVFQQISAAEASRILHLPRSTIYHRLNKAKTLLKHELEDWFYGDER